MSGSDAAGRRLEARAEAVEDLVRWVVAGQVRVPEFQRGLRWKAGDVLDLLDSVYRGYPIGSLLFFKRRAVAAELHLGPLRVHAPDVAEALWVVDGQQRLIALAASLARDDPFPATPQDPWVVFFDPEQGAFRAPPRLAAPPDHWVPAPRLLDATRLSEWVFTWPHARDERLRKAVFEAGKRLREYRVPLYALGSDEPELVGEVFARVNKSGRALRWNEIHDALYGHSDEAPGTIKQLARELRTVRMGGLAPDDLNASLLAIRGLDPTRTLAEHRRENKDVLRGAVAEALPALRRALHFLRDAEIPHLRLLPRTLVVDVLARFFRLHPEPRPRSLTLLTRWTWRVMLRDGTYEERTLRRRAVAAIDDDEEASLQRLLALLPREPHAPTWPSRYDARAALSRVVLLALAALRPRDPESGQPLDVAALVEAGGPGAWRPVFPPSRVPAALRDPANRLLLPGAGAARAGLLRCLRGFEHEPLFPARFDAGEILTSHGISDEAAEHLRQGEVEAFVRVRRATLERMLGQLGQRLAGWGRCDNDRPSIAYLVRDEAAGAGA